jgi:hypothetical protein
MKRLFRRAKFKIFHNHRYATFGVQSSRPRRKRVMEPIAEGIAGAGEMAQAVARSIRWRE